MNTKKKDIRSLTKEQLRDFFVKNGDKAFRGNQVYEWLWNKSLHTFEDMPGWIQFRLPFLCYFQIKKNAKLES